MKIDDFKETYVNKGTFANTKTFVKYINKILDLPEDEIHNETYVERFNELVVALIKTDRYPSTTQLSSKLGCLTGLLNRIYVSKPNPLISLVKSLSSTVTPLNLTPRATPFTAPKWTDVLTNLKVIIDKDYPPGAKIIATFYLHEYVLRVSEIFHTTFVKMDGFNHLDIENKEFVIYNHKNMTKSKEPRKFPITDEFINDIVKFRHPICPYLIFKNTFAPYLSTLTHTTVQMPDTIPSNSECRNSFEEWNYKHSGRPVSECEQWSLNVLGHSLNTVQEHYTRNDTVLEINEMLKEDKRKKCGFSKSSGKCIGYYRWW
jgi:hypothetical protein